MTKCWHDLAGFRNPVAEWRSRLLLVRDASSDVTHAVPDSSVQAGGSALKDFRPGSTAAVLETVPVGTERLVKNQQDTRQPP